MKISIAKALKEKNRLIGKINDVFNVISRENSKTITKYFTANSDKSEEGIRNVVESEMKKIRKIDVKEKYDEYIDLNEKLIELKTKIAHVNDGIAEELIRLSEYKARLAKVQNFTRYTDDTVSVTDNFFQATSSVFHLEDSEQWVEMYKKLINDTQDKIDEYNATHYIEIEL